MTTFYEEVGGTEVSFEELVSAFYAVVAVDPILSPMYPEKDWHAAAERLQYVSGAILGRTAHIL
jgi:hemoglobin